MSNRMVIGSMMLYNNSMEFYIVSKTEVWKIIQWYLDVLMLFCLVKDLGLNVYGKITVVF